MKLKRKISRDLKIGFSICFLYFIWIFCWQWYKYFVKGSLAFPYIPEMNIENELLSPLSRRYLLGTDSQGRSLFQVISEGLSYSLMVSFLVTLITSTLGLLVGFFAIRGSKLIKIGFDFLINLVFIFPSILIAILILAVTGQSLLGLIFGLVITGWTGYAKIARSETKRVVGLTYLEGAKALGASETRMFVTIFLPEILSVMIVNMVLGISGVILSEGALGFLGLGASQFSFGAMLSDAKTVLLESPHIAIILSLTLAGLIIGLNLLGDGLRDYLDPKES